MMLHFTKMHGLGNDFIVVDNTQGMHTFDTARIRSLSNRHFGIGFDQLLVVEKPTVDGAEFDYRIYNADGIEVEHCGNGARCFARFVTDKGLTTSRDIPVNTAAGIITLSLLDDDQVKVMMGVPCFEPSDIPLVAEREKLHYELVPEISLSDPSSKEPSGKEPSGKEPGTNEHNRVEFGALSIGNPHITLHVSDVDQAPVETLGPYLESHAMFPNRINVGFLQIIDRSHARVRVFERGVGETRACGTGACAAAVYGMRAGLLDQLVTVSLLGGDLDIFWPGDNQNVEMTGPCTTVFEGQTRM